MPAKKPSRPWRLLYTTNGSVTDTKHRSRPEADRAAAVEIARIADGSSRVVRIRIEKWDTEAGSWQDAATAYPTT
ncbi:hypothetical protein [Streptomyces cyaneofuscatus]|uniref:hypothetical protein n=1 Tax=Streptomyces cyaneofuscatus TaxID=66883 RepID=UPI00364CC4BA